MTTVPTLPTPPDPSNPLTFAELAEAWNDAIPGFGAAVNLVAGEINAASLAIANQMALSFPAVAGTSTTSMSIGAVGDARNFTTQAGKGFVAGMFLMVADTAAPATNYMVVQLLTYNSGTGDMTTTVAQGIGSGTKTAWNISVTMAADASAAPKTGDVKLATTAPPGWLPCEGAVYTKATYPALATLLGSIPGDYTWTARTPTGITAVSFVNYAAGLYVAAGDAAGNVSTSPDGITWTSRTGNLGANSPSEYAYFNSLHILTANGGMLSSSPTGVTWTARTANCGAGSIRLCAGTSRLVAFLQSSTTVSSSADGTTYTSRTMPAAISQMAFGNGIFVAAGNAIINTSADGDTWTARTAPDSGNYSTLLFLNGYFYLAYVASNQVTAFRSADGITWTAIAFNNPASVASLSIIVQGGAFLWNIRGVLYSSLDFSNWERQTSIMPGGVASAGAVNAGSGLVVLAGGASIYTSPDYDFNTSTQFRTPDLRAKVPQALQGKAKFYMKAA